MSRPSNCAVHMRPPMLLPVARPRCRSSPYQPAYTWARTKATPRRPMKFRPHIHSRDERCRDDQWAFRRIGHTCQHMRNHAQTLNPLARGYPITPDANFLPRQSYACAHTPDTGPVPWPLTAPSFTNRSAASESSRGESHLSWSIQPRAERKNAVGDQYEKKLGARSRHPVATFGFRR